MKRIFLLTTVFALGCAADPDADAPAHAPVIRRSDVAELGRRIWRNECGGTREGLVTWNAGEAFPSLGIGHFIWYPEGVAGPFEESFPQLMAYAARRGASVPSFFRGSAPWRDRGRFLSAAQSRQTEAMRDWLAAHVELQAAYLVERSRRSLGRMLAASSRPQEVEARYNALRATPKGCYALVDYVNFKGEGTKAGERYKGRGWGLLQVLEEMDGFPSGDAACREFSRAASVVLKRRVSNSPPSRGEARWLAGWLNRCRTYAP